MTPITNAEMFKNKSAEERHAWFWRDKRFFGKSTYTEEEWLKQNVRITPDVCPFCGRKVEIQDGCYNCEDNDLIWLECECGYRTRKFNNTEKDDLIAEHNRFVRAVARAEDEVV